MTYCLDSSSNKTCWYAEDKSSLENFSPPFSCVNNSSAVGMGYSGTPNTGFIVTLLSPQIHTEPSGFRTGTIGVAQSVNSTFSKTPSLSNLLSSSAIFSFKAKGTGLGLKNCGVAFSLSLRWAVTPLIVPRPPSNNDAYLETRSSTLSYGSWEICLICFQSSVRTDNQFRPISAGPLPAVTITGRQACWSPYDTWTLASPTTGIPCPE